MKATLIVLSVIATLLLSACRHSQSGPNPDRVDKLFAAWNRADSPGCAVGIRHNGAIVYEHGYGMANLELRVPITRDTVFAIASITKSFTSTSVMLAARQGRLSLDDQVQKYIPEWQDKNDSITVRHLLTHTSGMRDGFGLLGFAEPSESAGDYNEAIVKILARQRGLNFQPGTEYQYNNGGYNLLASILKRSTGESLREFTDANIFKPLGMTHTVVHDDPAVLVPNRASGYSRNESGWRKAKEDGGIVGNAGMYSTVGDLLKWESNLENPHVGTKEMFAEMEKPTALAGGKTSVSGMGFGVTEYRGLRNIGHNGGDYGIATNVTRFPDQRFAVAVLCNIDHISMGGTTTVNPEELATSVADIYLADALAPANAANPPKSAAAPVQVKLSERELSDRAGLYRVADLDFPILVAADNGTLMARSYYGDDFPFPLIPVTANRFLLRNSIPFEFVPAASGRTGEWHVGEGKDQRVWLPVTYMLPASEFRSYAGTFRSEELRLTFTLVARDSELVVMANGRPDVTITPFLKDVFVGHWVGIVKFARDAHGAISGFTVNRDNVRGVRFDVIKHGN